MNLTYDALDKNIATELKPLYLLYGEEQYLIKNFLLCLGDAIDIISVD